MKNLDEFRRIMKHAWQEEKANRSIVLVGKSLEEILAQASIELSLPLHKLDYEVQIRGSKGFLFGTFGKRSWRVMVYPARKHMVTKQGVMQKAGLDDHHALDLAQEEQRDGLFGFLLNKNGEVMLKVVASVGDGKDVEVDDILKKASQMRSIPHLDEAAVRRTVMESSGVWVKVAEYAHNASADSSFTVLMSDDEMKATITLSTPGVGGATVTYEEMKNALHQAGVFAGIQEDALNELEMNPVYRTAMVVAMGVPARAGEDTRIQCLHETDLSEKSIQVDSKGSIDFKRMTSIHSVAAGDVVARVLQPTDGIPGMTVRGSMIAAKNGEKKAINLGANVRISDDETEVIATNNGQLIIKEDIVSVENIYTVEGDLKSHIDFLGTVVINGNIEDGYEVKAKGDITVTGSVGRSQLTAEGNIIVGNGINGNKYGDGASGDAVSFVKAGKSLWASFIQNCYVEANQMVVVSDGILNSNVLSLGKVLCKGKRAAIVGGRVRALDEINAVVFGSNSGTTTVLEVGVNPKLKDNLSDLETRNEKHHDALVDLRRIIDNWSEASRTRPLPPEKKSKFDEMIAQADEINREIQENKEQMKAIKEQLNARHDDAKIAASLKIHGGVEIIIGDYEYQVTSEYNKGQTFYLEQDQIKIKGYEAITDDITPDVEEKKKRYSKNKVSLS
ncbi:FapA family protein [Entomospira culicis]|uniref:FapA family protein n=1 Tax=Entomospira culicis TaxID=2719989 RepID=A0A968GHM6_9SPIO|nr:FapA family protein [Entomospira culicis]NIZ18982.1 FapA family protein [Entomospira culicis]NIZ69197.1 FapA family protein [Entomospira culicis]WDI37783.1 FapA family protein [Entomospira culicis]WDI39411.1 FapA family protein [Entomospira culicis]